MWHTGPGSGRKPENNGRKEKENKAMKRWKKYVFCVICACCVGLLAGCGNKNDGVTQNGKATEVMPETKENRKETPNAEINDKRATEPEETTVNDATDRSDTDTGVGGAAKDIVDGVGDAGKDIIDGVEDAGDALTGEDAKQNATGE